MQKITMASIASIDIIAVPSETVCGEAFRFANIARVKMRDGADLDILFDETGQPAIDPGLVKRIGDHFGKTFEPILFDGRSAYAQKNNNGQKS